MNGRMGLLVAVGCALLAGNARAQEGSWYVEPLGVLNDVYTCAPTISVAVDGAGGTHLAVVRSDGTAEYRYRPTVGASWQAEWLGGPYFDYETKVALDPQGNPHVVFRDSNWQIVHLAKGPDGTWTRTIVAPYASYVSLAVDQRGVAHVTYSEFVYLDGSYVHYATVEAGSVTTQELIGRGRSGTIAVDGLGVPHVAIAAMLEYSPDDVQGLFYAVRGPAGWELEQVVQSSDGGFASAEIAVDAAGAPRLYGLGNGGYYAERGEAGWVVSAAYGGVASNYSRPLAVDAFGRVHHVSADGYVRYRVLQDGTWTETVIGRGEYSVALALDPAGLPVLGFYRILSGPFYLEYQLATFDPASPETAATISGTAGTAPWYVSPVTVDLAAADAHTGVAELRFSVDGAPEVTVSGSSASIQLDAEGVHQLTYRAVDRAGNVEATRTLTVSIDMTPPTVAVAPSTSVLWPPNGAQIPVIVTGGASDGVAGVASVAITVLDEYGTFGATVPGFGSTVLLEAARLASDPDGRIYTISAVATDAAGNTATASAVVNVPRTQ